MYAPEQSLTGCEDDLTISGSTDKLETVDGVYGYVRSAAGARELTPITLFGDKAGTGHLFFELTKAAEQDVTVTFKIDKDALEAYNEANNTSYEMYPVDKLSLANDGKITVKAGEKKSASMELNINAGGTIGTTYAVAVSAYNRRWYNCFYQQSDIHLFGKATTYISCAWNCS